MDKHQSLDDSLWSLMDELRRGMAVVIGAFGLTPPHALVLKALDTPKPMKTIAAELVFDPSYLTNLADNLEERGYLERVADPTDRRVKMLALTEAGFAARASFFGSVVGTAVGLDRLSIAEREQLRKLLAKAYPE
jgi:DNA-binding MarR family transcriptional regulator